MSARYLRKARSTLKHALTFDGLEADVIVTGQLLLSRVAFLLGEIEEARDLARQALDAAISSELVWLQARAQALLGEVCAATRQAAQAETYFQHALDIFTTTDMRLERARVLQAYAQSVLLPAPGSAARQQALASLQEAHQIFQACHAALDEQSAARLLAGISVPAEPAPAGTRRQTRRSR